MHNDNKGWPTWVKLSGGAILALAVYYIALFIQNLTREVTALVELWSVRIFVVGTAAFATPFIIATAIEGWCRVRDAWDAKARARRRVAAGSKPSPAAVAEPSLAKDPIDLAAANRIRGLFRDRNGYDPRRGIIQSDFVGYKEEVADEIFSGGQALDEVQRNITGLVRLHLESKAASEETLKKRPELVAMLAWDARLASVERERVLMAAPRRWLHIITVGRIPFPEEAKYRSIGSAKLDANPGHYYLLHYGDVPNDIAAALPMPPDWRPRVPAVASRKPPPPLEANDDDKAKPQEKRVEADAPVPATKPVPARDEPPEVVKKPDPASDHLRVKERLSAARARLDDILDMFHGGGEVWRSEPQARRWIDDGLAFATVHHGAHDEGERILRDLVRAKSRVKTFPEAWRRNFVQNQAAHQSGGRWPVTFIDNAALDLQQSAGTAANYAKHVEAFRAHALRHWCLLENPLLPPADGNTVSAAAEKAPTADTKPDVAEAEPDTEPTPNVPADTDVYDAATGM